MNDKIKPEIIIFILLQIFFLNFLFNASSAGTLPADKTEISLVDTSAVTLSDGKNLIPVWLTVPAGKKDSVNISVLQTKSINGENISITYKIIKDTSNIYAAGSTQLFFLLPDKSTLSKLSDGRYTITFLIQSGSEEQSIQKIVFAIPSSTSLFNVFSNGVEWVKDNLLVLLWYIIEIIIFLLVLIAIINFLIFIPLRGKRKSLKVLPIINETGKDFDGVASGIDDIFMNKLLEIAKLGETEDIKQHWIPQEGEDRKTKSQSLSVVGGDLSLEFQKLGDISVGPVKIPLGAISALLLKLFGGYYVSGALQQYGSKNKLVINIENRYSLIKFKKSAHSRVRYFEVTWPADNIKEKDLAEGIPEVVDELAYKISLYLSENFGTEDWRAFKYFLEGNQLFAGFDNNRTRRDILKDAVASWRRSIRFDPDFAKAHYNLGVALDLKGEFEDAIFRYQKAIQLSPELIAGEAHYNLSKLYWDIFKDEIKTKDELEKVKKIMPSLSYAYNLEGLVMLDKKDYPNAALLFTKAVELSTKPNPVFYYNLSVAEYYNDNFLGAEKAGLQSIRLSEEENIFSGLLQTLGWIYNRLAEADLQRGNTSAAKEKYKTAADYFSQGLLQEPDYQALLDGYGIALRESGKLNQAFVIQKRHIRLWPEFERGYTEIAKTMQQLQLQETNTESCNTLAELLEDNSFLKDVNRVDAELDQSSIETKKLLSGAMGMYQYHLSVSKRHIDYNAANEHLNLAKKYLEYSMGVSVSDENYFLDAELYHAYALVLFSLRNYETSIAEFNSAIKLYLQNDFNSYDLAGCYYELGKINREIKKFSEADISYRSSINYFKKAGLTNRASDVHIEDARTLIEWYRHGGDEQCYEWARVECNLAINLNNKNYEAYHVKGNTYYDLNYFAEAIPQYEIAVELNYDLPGAHYNLGLCYKHLGEPERAAKSFATSVKLDEDYGDPLNEGKPDPYEELATCFEKMKHNDKIIKKLKHVVNIFPTSAKYNALLGKYLEKSGLTNEAVKKYKDALRVDKNNKQNMQHIILNKLANLYFKQGADFVEANRMVFKAFRFARSLKHVKEEDLYSIYNTLGWVCYNHNHLKWARSLLEKSLTVNVDSLTAHLRLAKVLKTIAETSDVESEKKSLVEKSAVHLQIAKDLENRDKSGILTGQN